jgi:hypothetical protein
MSWNFDLSGIFDYAAVIFNSFAPIIAVIAGLVLGAALVTFVLNMVSKVFKAG